MLTKKVHYLLGAYQHLHTINTYTQSTPTHNQHLHTINTYTQSTPTHNQHLHTINTIDNIIEDTDNKC
ncbi:hypothetical protein EVJ70_02425 [Staphylococcus aureus]|nr:hypothetical protein EVJ70_02425 [Staphylococcus aureus]